MNVNEFRKTASRRISSVWQGREADNVILILLSSRLAMEHYRILAEGAMTIPSDKMALLEEDLDKLSRGCPVQYVIGSALFCGHRFKVSPACLIPRPETEELVEKIVEDFSEIEKEGGFNILDMCTGSGCIAWSLAEAFPDAHVFACDISDEALSLACRQRIKLSGAKPVFFKADVLAAPPAGLPRFDIIVSNPPYVMESEKSQMRRDTLEYEPPQALFVPDDDPLKFYRAVSSWADALLERGGRIYCEINEKLGPQTASVFPGCAVLDDINGKNRFIRL